MGGEQALELVTAVEEPAEVAGEGDEEGDDDDPGQLHRKFQVTAGDDDQHAADDEKNEVADHHAAGFAMVGEQGVEFGDGGRRAGHQVILARRTRLEMPARAVAAVISRSL